jgi:hypothetical protein
VARIAGVESLITGTANRRRAIVFPTAARGEIQAYTPGRGGGFETFYPQAAADDPTFLPAGIAVIELPGAGPGKRQRIFVANGAADKRAGTSGRVDVFEFEGGKLVRKGALGSGLPFQPNGIAAARDGTVYVSGFSILPTGCDNPVFKMPEGKAAHKNCIFRFTPSDSTGRAGTWNWIAGGLDGINGVALSSDQSTLLVSAYHSKRVWALDVDAIGRETGERARPLINRLEFHPDNLKHLGGDRFTVCGQSSRWGAAIELIAGLPVSPGGALEFHLKGGIASGEKDLTPLMKGNRTSPSTAYEHGGAYYFAHVTARGVGRVQANANKVASEPHVAGTRAP